MPAARIHILCIDALPYFLLRQFLSRGQLPNFRKLEKLGASAQGMIPPWPDATTPPAHASILCGCSAVEHGIFSFEEPLIENGVVSPWRKTHGFDAARLKAEPLWVKFLQAGKKVALLHFPLSTPVETLTSSRKFGDDFSDRLFIIEGYGRRLTPEIVRQDVNSDDPFRLKLSDRGKVLLPRRAPKTLEPAVFKDRMGGLWRLRFSSENHGEPDLHFLTPFSALTCHPAELGISYLEKLGPFPASGATYSYGKDKLGARIYKGGSGLAEQRLGQSLELLAEHVFSAMKFVLEKVQPEAGFYYFNAIDLCLHLWLAYLEPGFAKAHPEIFNVLWPLLCRMMNWADKMVGLLLESLGPKDLLVVFSDHGMAPIDAVFYPNQVLADAGLLAWDSSKNEPDLAKSLAVYNGSNAGYVVLNLKSRGGIVPDQEAERLAAKVAAAFAPFLGQALDKIELTTANPAIPGLGELYLIPRFRLTLQEEVEGKILDPDFRGGQHHYWPEVEEMKAVLYFCGAGVPAGARLGVRSHLEVAGTVAALAGIEPPNRAGFRPIKFQEVRNE